MQLLALGIGHIFIWTNWIKKLHHKSGFFDFAFLVYVQNKILNSSKDNNKVVPGKDNFDKNKALQFILERRSIFPKEYIPDGKVSDDELNIILEAGNWAPTHNKNEPWRLGGVI